MLGHKPYLYICFYIFAHHIMAGVGSGLHWGTIVHGHTHVYKFNLYMHALAFICYVELLQWLKICRHKIVTVHRRVCAYIYIYKHMYLHTFTYACIHTIIHKILMVHRRVCAYIYVYKHMYFYIYKYACIHIIIHKIVIVHRRVCAYIYIHKHMCLQTYTYA